MHAPPATLPGGIPVQVPGRAGAVSPASSSNMGSVGSSATGKAVPGVGIARMVQLPCDFALPGTTGSADSVQTAHRSP